MGLWYIYRPFPRQEPLFGNQVIPEFDKDPVHSTVRYREKAVPKFGPFGEKPPDIVAPAAPPL